MDSLEEKLSNNDKLTEAEKQEILSEAENKYQKKVGRGEQRRAESQAYVEKIHNDTSLTPEEKRKAVKEYFKEKKEENKDFRKERN